MNKKDERARKTHVRPTRELLSLMKNIEIDTSKLIIRRTGVVRNRTWDERSRIRRQTLLLRERRSRTEIFLTAPREPCGTE